MNKRTIEEISVQKNVSIFESIKILDQTAMQILMVTDHNGGLIGTVTDGDIRRAILRGKKLDAPISSIMNKNPITINKKLTRTEAISLLTENSINCVPVLNADKKIIRLETMARSFFNQDYTNTSVVIMAGGLGTRLRPLTNATPKPMLKINGKPLLERMILNLSEQGFNHFFISVNYKAEMIKNYFQNGEKFGVKIEYLEEAKPLGTGGALSLLPESLKSKHLIIMNGDLLTDLNFQNLLEFHTSQKSAATMAVRDHRIEVPYGVVDFHNEIFSNLVEKPLHTFFVNVGIYVINKKELKYIPNDQFYDLPELFNILKTKRKKVTVFPLREYWRDIGNISDFKQAQKE